MHRREPIRLFPTLVAALAILVIFCSCDALGRLDTDPALATAKASTPSPGPDCASCHAYPLRDVNHQYHLVAANVNRNNLGQPELNGVTTCMDCHFNSVRRFGYVHSDTTWMDADGVELLQRTSPTDRVMKIDSYPRWRPVPYPGGDTLRGESLADDIDSLIFRKSRLGEVVSWMTSHAHQNGRVEVAFPPNDVTRPEMASSAYRPADLSCSSVTCHTTREARYRWEDPSRGFSNCPSLDGNDPTCGETDP